jgi:two-component system chemotaxis sensor kinase CheA
MSAMDAQILEVFFAEAGERVDRMVELLMGIEDGSAPSDAVDAIFREAHSVKGSAGMVGLDRPRAIAHELEDELNRARGAGALGREQVEPLLRLADELRRSLGDTPAEPVAPAPAAATIRMPAEKVDRLLDAVGESALQMGRLEHVLDRTAGDGTAAWELDRGRALFSELQRAAIDMRTLPLSSITGRYPRAVRDIAAATGKEVALVIEGTDTQLDRVILEGLGDALAHLLRNAVAHGIEAPEERRRAGKPAAGRVRMSAEQRGNVVAVDVSDDGRGVSAALLEQARAAGSLVDVLAAPGFSTAPEVSDVAGRGVGLDAVKEHVEALGGSMEIESVTGAGTTIRLLLPYSVALTRVLMIERDGHPFGVPLAAVEEVVVIAETLALGGREALELRGRPVPLADLSAVLGARTRPLPERARALVVRASGRRRAIACDGVLGEHEVVVKSLGPLLAGVPGYLGAAIVDDGAIAPILDPAWLAAREGSAAPAIVAAQPAAAAAPKVLVVDDQFTVRELQRSILEAAGYRVTLARDGREAYAQVGADAEIDLVVTDVNMPEMDGFQLLEAIRRDPRRSALPVVLLTSLGNEEDRRRGAEAGADAHIVKDQFDQRALLDTLDRLLSR